MNMINILLNVVAIKANNESLKEYFDRLTTSIPHSIYLASGIILCIGFLLPIKLKDFKKGVKILAIFALVEYIILLYASTVYYRQTNPNVGHDWHPFWSYQIIETGNKSFLYENVMNIVVFIPIGILVGLACRNIKWWFVLLIGFGLSVSIEAFQYIYSKGFSEFDDVMHNTLGCMIGYCVYALLRYGYNERIRKRRLGTLIET